MSKEDPSGLLSKVVRFVKNPASWNELDQQEEERDSHYNKQALKEMIERKRRNDFVRRREFDQLRKLRKREALTPPADGQGRPSFFQSSLASRPDDRAVTLKKIDEIEAQMSMQWWRSKHGQPPAGVQAGDTAPLSSNFPPSRAGKPSVVPASGDAAQAAATARAFAPTLNAPFTQAGELPAKAPMVASTVPQGEHWDAAVPPGGFPAFAATAVQVPLAGQGEARTGGAAAGYLGAEVPPFVHLPELEEAAIRFANGDGAGAEAALLDLLQDPTASREEEVWMALFDLYRALGEQDRFEGVAIDFASRFGRSGPLWMRFGTEPESSHGVDAPASAIGFRWTAPESLAPAAVAALKTALSKAPQPWELDWSRLIDIPESAVDALGDLVAGWASSPVRLRWAGMAVFDDVLRARTASGDAEASQAWWRLRMESLRLMGRAEEFELVALDYCVTYELSPPSWVDPVCECAVLSKDHGDGPPSIQSIDAGPLSVSSIHSEFPTTALALDLSIQDGGHLSSSATVDLAGEILGDPTDLLPEAAAHPPKVLVVGCADLVRIDFSAAGSVLNWAAARQAEGTQVQFRGLQRLVAVFFNVIGINEHARVIPRLD